MVKAKRKTAPRRKPAVKRAPARKRVVKRAPARRLTQRQAAARKAQAAKLYSDFHGRAPSFKSVKAPKSPTHAMLVGKLEAVIYQTPDGKRYKHEFRTSRPNLVASHDGRRLFVQGGRYRMTWRGIVDKRK